MVHGRQLRKQFLRLRISWIGSHNPRQLLSRITAKPQQVRSTIMSTDIQETLCKDGCSVVKISKYKTLCRRVQGFSQQSAIRSEDGRVASSRAVHKEASFGRHNLDAFLRNHRRGM